MVDFIFGEEKKTVSPKYKDKIDFEVFPVACERKSVVT